MDLLDIYRNGFPLADRELKLLYRILKERDDITSISHRHLPSWQEHEQFVASMPYRHWFIVVAEDLGDDEDVGACYLTRQYELGVFILRKYQGRGYGPQAMKMVIDMYPGVALFSNVNPRNGRSIRMLRKLGFQHVQNTYRLPASLKTGAGQSRHDAETPASAETAPPDRPGEE